MSRAEEEFPQPPWYQAAMWTGADLRALLRLFNANGWRVPLASWPGCCIDLAFGMANSTLGALQSIIYRSRIERVEFERDPLFIIGHWRTGTTLLHELLTLDPRHTYPTTYQCFMPCHFLLTERLLKPWTGFALPSNRPPDQMRTAWDSPQEDEFALCNLGVPSPYATIAFPNNPPVFMEYLSLESLSPQERTQWHLAWMRFLKSLQYHKPGRLVLKSPTHTCRLPALLELFPNACFVNMVRHPMTVYLSTVRLWKSLFSTHGYQTPLYLGLNEFVLTTFDQMHRRLETTRELVPPGRLIDVYYENLVDDMVGTMQSIYEQLELDGFSGVERLIQEYVVEHRGYKPNQHHVTSELEAEVYERWRTYYEKYGYSRFAT
ncbi:MAG: sulfotransferase [Planctomycetaceae bacterium]|nr:sulfotransferase [Planctomycetales bacterium]MCB9926561.1 sulfotransferase [Planctomycetaceae bacterium]